MPNLVKIGLELLPKMSGNQVGRRTPEKAKIICQWGGHNKHAVKLRMHKAAPYAFPIPLNTF